MKKTRYSIAVSFLTAAALMLAGCEEKEMGNLELSGETKIISLTLDGQYSASPSGSDIIVQIPSEYDATAMTLSDIELSPGAVSNIEEGEVLNMEYPQTITVTNGNVIYDYTMTVQHDKAEILSFMLDGRYNGAIEGNTINVFVPLGTDVTAMSISYTLSEGATADRSVGEVLDFTNPVQITATYRTDVRTYTVYVTMNDISDEPKAFVGMQATMAELGNEAKAACDWAMKNIPNITYVSLSQIIDGSVKLSDYKLLWCHFDWTDWPSQAWDSRDNISAFWLQGGRILATRDGARYINDVWCIAINQQGPNNTFGGESYTTLTEPSGFTVYPGAEGHELFEDLTLAEDGQILLRAVGCSTSGRTLQWGIDWDPYFGLDGWKSLTGATPLGSDAGGDPNRVTIAEFAPRESAGYTSGTVITIGTPAFEWYDRNAADNQYYANLEQLTKNAINYLCK